MMALFDQEKAIEQFGYEKMQEGNIKTLYDLYSDGDITLQRAAVKAGMSESAFLETEKKLQQ